MFDLLLPVFPSFLSSYYFCFRCSRFDCQEGAAAQTPAAAVLGEGLGSDGQRWMLVNSTKNPRGVYGDADLDRGSIHCCG